MCLVARKKETEDKVKDKEKTFEKINTKWTEGWEEKAVQGTVVI